MKDNQAAGWNLENTYASLPKSLFTSFNPTPVKAPKLVILNHTLAETLGLNNEALQSTAGVAVFSGNKLPEGAEPLAQAYAGHQFGGFNRLGDGRAILLGEQITPNGERFDIQLKGPGKTPYSRGGDGRAALGPMLREYIISEAMYALDIPTTRSLAVVTTGEWINREIKLPGAVLTRIASSHIRVGTFEYIAQWGTVEELKELADYTMNRHYPEVKDAVHPYISLLEAVIKRQAELIAKWQLVGFIHGVMNTDNMTISGETIDYGPCAFMDTYDPATVFSSIDRNGRYAYGNQPSIAGWNLARFAEALLPLLHDDINEAVKVAENALLDFTGIFETDWLAGMRKKLGLFNEEEQDEVLINRLLDLMKKYRADYTNTFLGLTFEGENDGVLFNTSEFTSWKVLWFERRERQAQSKAESDQLMRDSNPAVIPRNHQVEAALEAAETKGDYSVMERLLDMLSNPYAHSKEQEEYAKPAGASATPYQTYCGT